MRCMSPLSVTLLQFALSKTTCRFEIKPQASSHIDRTYLIFLIVSCRVGEGCKDRHRLCGCRSLDTCFRSGRHKEWDCNLRTDIRTRQGLDSTAVCPMSTHKPLRLLWKSPFYFDFIQAIHLGPEFFPSRCQIQINLLLANFVLMIQHSLGKKKKKGSKSA